VTEAERDGLEADGLEAADEAVSTEEAAPEDDDVARLATERDEYLALAQRVQADFDNYRKRAAREQERLVRHAHERLVRELLPILDDLERALQSVDAHLAGLTWVDGIRLIYRKFQAVLEMNGVNEIEADGKDFDPNYHEAVAFAQGEEGKVLSVVQKGYMLNNRVLRPSMVVVGKAGAPAG
jgi:molecular chaperone GrpE